MSINTTIAKLRRELLGNRVTEPELARALDMSRRNIQRLRLPHIKVGRTRYYDVPGSHRQLVSTETEN